MTGDVRFRLVGLAALAALGCSIALDFSRSDLPRAHDAGFAVDVPTPVDAVVDVTVDVAPPDAPVEEAVTGYLRDQNVFRDGIDIPDQMSLNVRYRTGEVLTYSLVCFSPREGMRVTFKLVEHALRWDLATV